MIERGKARCQPSLISFGVVWFDSRSRFHFGEIMNMYVLFYCVVPMLIGIIMSIMIIRDRQRINCNRYFFFKTSVVTVFDLVLWIIYVFVPLFNLIWYFVFFEIVLVPLISKIFKYIAKIGNKVVF